MSKDTYVSAKETYVSAKESYERDLLTCAICVVCSTSFICVCDAAYLDVWRATYTCAIWRIHSRDTTDSMRDMSDSMRGMHSWTDSMRGMHSSTWYDWLYARHVGHDSVICVTWLMPIRNHMYLWYWPLSYVRHDSFIQITRLTLCATCSTWLIYSCDMTYSHVQQYVRVIQPVSCVWHDAFIHVTRLPLCATWLIHSCNTTSSMRDMTHSFM